MATKETIKHMAAGLRNEKTALILQAGTFPHLTDAINKIHEVNPSNDASVLHTRIYNNNRNNFEHTNRADRNQRYGTHDQGRRPPPRKFNSNYRSGNRNYDHNDRRSGFDRRLGQYNSADNGLYRQQSRNQNSRANWRTNNNNSTNVYRNNRNIYATENVREPAGDPLTDCAMPMNTYGENENIITGQAHAQRPSQ